MSDLAVAELGVKIQDGVPVVNSRDVAVHFEKQHAHVLRDIEEIKQKHPHPNLDVGWFRFTPYADAQGQMRPAYDLTRDGFTLLVMGWTGERAMAFKVAYIDAFNLMETALKEGKPVTTGDLLAAIREIVSPLRVRFDYQDKVIDRIEKRQDAMAEDIGAIKLRLDNVRRRISPATKSAHIDAIQQLGGRCQCCGENEIVCNSEKLPFSEFDHFYQNSFPDVDHTWLICKWCHNKLTTGRVARDQVEAHFRSYQSKRRTLPGQQVNLFL